MRNKRLTIKMSSRRDLPGFKFSGGNKEDHSQDDFIPGQDLSYKVH